MLEFVLRPSVMQNGLFFIFPIPKTALILFFRLFYPACTALLQLPQHRLPFFTYQIIGKKNGIALKR